MSTRQRALPQRADRHQPVTSASYLLTAQVYVPDHLADKDSAINPWNNLFVGTYSDREGFGLRTPGGSDSQRITFVTNQWNELIVRADDEHRRRRHRRATPTTAARCSTASSSNGVQIGGTFGGALDPTQMHLRNGDVHLSAFFGLERGNQQSAAEAFVDDIQVFQVFTPEPGALCSLLMGAGLLLRRRNHKPSR
jgi:hypothetical protein